LSSQAQVHDTQDSVVVSGGWFPRPQSLERLFRPGLPKNEYGGCQVCGKEIQ
jgi:hypothetical protein